MNQVIEEGQIKFDVNKVQLDVFSVKSNLIIEMSETFGHWLKETRKKCGYNQTELAERARVSKNYISLLEANKIVQPRLNQIDKIAKALNVPTDEARSKLVAGYTDTENNQSDELVSINFDFEGLPEKEVEKADYLKDLLEEQIKKLEKLKKEGLE